MNAQFLLQTGRITQTCGAITVIAMFWYGVFISLMESWMQGITLISISFIIAWSVALIAGGCFLAAESYRHQTYSD